MLEVLRSSVNTWECDQMGHMNVRHYFARAGHGLGVLGARLGYAPRALARDGLVLRARDQHVRFHHELRPGAPYRVSAGVLEATSERLRLYEELFAVASNRVSATIVNEVQLTRADDDQQVVPFSSDALARARATELSVQLPEHAAPRGMTLDPPRDGSRLPAHGDALSQRMVGAFLGPVLREDCDAHGFMLESNFMARISDGIGHFFARIRQGLRPDGVGGAALEYRFVYRERPRAGDVIEVRSALTGLGPKTLHLAHAVFNLETGACAATSEAVAVSFDLTTRRAVAIDDLTRAQLSTHLLPELRGC